MKKKVIFLDWSKTLSLSVFWEQFRDPSNKYHEFYEEISQWLFVNHRHLVNKWMLGDLTSEAVCKKVADGIGLPYEIIMDGLINSCKSMSFVSEEIPRLVRSIRSSGIKCVIATDNMDTFRRFTIPSMNLEGLFDDFLISCELGVCKYDVGHNSIPFFDNYLGERGLTYRDVVLIDDSMEQTGIFNQLGFDLFLINTIDDLLHKLKEYVH